MDANVYSSEPQETGMPVSGTAFDSATATMRPGASNSSTVGNSFWRYWAAWSASLLLVLLLGLLGWWYFHNASFLFVIDYLRGQRVIAYPHRLSVGSVPVGEQRQFHFTIWNATGSPVTIIGNRRTCGCLLMTEAPPLTIAAGQRTNSLCLSASDRTQARSNTR